MLCAFAGLASAFPEALRERPPGSSAVVAERWERVHVCHKDHQSGSISPGSGDCRNQFFWQRAWLMRSGKPFRFT